MAEDLTAPDLLLKDVKAYLGQCLPAAGKWSAVQDRLWHAVEYLRRACVELAARNAALEKTVKDITAGLADRVAAQSELLSRRAERPVWHFSVSQGRAACGSEHPNQGHTTVLLNVTCEACRELMGDLVPGK